MIVHIKTLKNFLFVQKILYFKRKKFLTLKTNFKRVLKNSFFKLQQILLSLKKI